LLFFLVCILIIDSVPVFRRLEPLAGAAACIGAGGGLVWDADGGPLPADAMLETLLNPMAILVTWPVLLFSLSLHEYMHAWTADRLGDPTPRYAGRLTVNPLAHYDVIGTTLGLVFRVFGWAKPVPVNEAVFKWPKRDMMLTSLGGPALNLALALGFALVFKLLGAFFPVHERAALGGAAKTVELIERMAAYGVLLNLVLAFFNLIPLYPLDGHHVLRGFLSFRAAMAYDRVKHWGGYLLMALVLLSFASPGVGVFSILIGGPVRFMMALVFSASEMWRISELIGPLIPVFG
jgi:Zn-dependent protease